MPVFFPQKNVRGFFVIPDFAGKLALAKAVYFAQFPDAPADRTRLQLNGWRRFNITIHNKGHVHMRCMAKIKQRTGEHPASHSFQITVIAAANTKRTFQFQLAVAAFNARVFHTLLHGVNGERDVRKVHNIDQVRRCRCDRVGFPTLIALLSMFFMVAAGSAGALLCAVMLVGLIVLSVAVTLLCSRLLSQTVLKGVPSSFSLELPPFRRPRVGQVIVRSVFDRTLFVLGRAVSVAAPAGLCVWVLANVYVGDTQLLRLCADFLDPAGRLMGMDGVIMLAFILGFPANEIVLPIMLMTYLAQGTLIEPQGLDTLRALLVDNGWTVWTAACVALFSLFHWPCSTTVLTIYKETRSVRWTGLAILLPTLVGCAMCITLAFVSRLF